MEMKSSLVTLQPGMYILRHPKGGLPPLSVSRAPGGTGRHEILATPRTQGTILRDGTDCIVMRVFEGPIELLVTAYLAQPSMVTPAMRVDQIGLDPEPVPGVHAVPLKGKPLEIAGRGISLIGHIERLGDVVVGPGETLGQPSNQLRIEGFQVMWPDKPEGLELVYGLTLEGSEATPMVGLGQFCGTRNMARRITEATFALTGSNAQQFDLQGVAHFSGGFMAPLQSGIALSGPSGSEHLTALSLTVVPATQATKPARNAWTESGRTKVFKAKASVEGSAQLPKKPSAKAAVNSKQAVTAKKPVVTKATGKTVKSGKKA